MGDESYLDTACVLNINIYLYYEYVKIDGVDLKKIKIPMIIPCVVTFCFQLTINYAAPISSAARNCHNEQQVIY